MIPSIKEIENLNLRAESDSWKNELLTWMRTEQGFNSKDALKAYNEIVDFIDGMGGYNAGNDKNSDDYKEAYKGIGKILDKYKQNKLTPEVIDIIANNSADWKATLENLLEEDGLDNLYFNLSQSILEDGTKRNNNDFLEYLNRLPVKTLKNLEKSTQDLILDLMDEGELDVYQDGWLTDENLYYYSGGKPQNLEYLIKSIIFLADDRNLRQYGDPESEYLPNIIDDRGNLISAPDGKPWTAPKVKEALAKWQQETKGKATNKYSKNSQVTGVAILKNILKLSKDVKVTISDVVRYARTLSSLKDDLKKYNDKTLESLLKDDEDLKEILYAKYRSLDDVKNLNNALSKEIAYITDNIRAAK